MPVSPFQVNAPGSTTTKTITMTTTTTMTTRITTKHTHMCACHENACPEDKTMPGGRKRVIDPRGKPGGGRRIPHEEALSRFLRVPRALDVVCSWFLLLSFGTKHTLQLVYLFCGPLFYMYFSFMLYQSQTSCESFAYASVDQHF